MTLSDCPLGNDNVGTELVDVGGKNDVRLEDKEKVDGYSDSNRSGDGNSNSISQIPYKATAKNIKSTYGTTAQYNLKLVDKSGGVIVGKQVQFKIKNKVYNIKTNNKRDCNIKTQFQCWKIHNPILC